MEGTAVAVGIDVSKDRLDVHVRPSGETLTVERTAAGLDVLCRRLREIAPRIVALEATGGLETIATAALAAGWSSSTRPRCAPSPGRSAAGPRPTRSMPP